MNQANLKKYLPTILILVGFLAVTFYMNNKKKSEAAGAYKGIDISKTNAQYWIYNGKRVLLLGGSSEDNLFQSQDIDKELDLIKSIGGNYVRCTMSSRDSGNVWPFAKNEDGLYDLNNFNTEYWIRFDKFLEATKSRDIIVQVEVWATFDFYRDNWLNNPFNPANNVNYDARIADLDSVVDSHPIFTENNFFRAVPRQMANPHVLRYQQKFVDKLLSHSLDYDHVLYCIDNETSVNADWGEFWSNYIKRKASAEKKIVHTTEMWDPWDLSHPFHDETFMHPETYSFVDISQNNHNQGDIHWQNGLAQIAKLKNNKVLRPVNNIKVYGNDGGKHHTTQNGVECFVRNAMMGCASTRFHRPNSGQGINLTAQNVIKSVRELSKEMNWFSAKPANNMLIGRDTNEAYCRAVPNMAYAVYFPAGGEVNLNLAKFRGKPSIKWVNVTENTWTEFKELEKSNSVPVTAPGNENWIALIRRNK